MGHTSSIWITDLQDREEARAREMVELKNDLENSIVMRLAAAREEIQQQIPDVSQARQEALAIRREAELLKGRAEAVLHQEGASASTILRMDADLTRYRQEYERMMKMQNEVRDAEKRVYSAVHLAIEAQNQTQTMHMAVQTALTAVRQMTQENATNGPTVKNAPPTGSSSATDPMGNQAVQEAFSQL